MTLGLRGRHVRPERVLERQDAGTVHPVGANLNICLGGAVNEAAERRTHRLAEAIVSLSKLDGMPLVIAVWLLRLLAAFQGLKGARHRLS